LLVCSFWSSFYYYFLITICYFFLYSKLYIASYNQVFQKLEIFPCFYT
jgi:hypothetical protein